MSFSRINRSCRILAAVGSLTILLVLSFASASRSYAQGSDPPPFVKACADESEGTYCSFNRQRDGQLKEGVCEPSQRRVGVLVCLTEAMRSAGLGQGGRSDQGKSLSIKNCKCEIERNLRYRSADGWDTKFTELDIYHRGNNGKRPVLVFVHGGGWVEGDKSNIALNKNMVNSFLDSGYVVAAVNFRLIEKKRNSKVKYADMAQDIAGSIKWLSQNVQDYGGDPQFFVLLGHSSGAHMAALLGTDASYLEDQELSLDIIRGVITFDIHVYDIPGALKAMKGTAFDKRIERLEQYFGDTEKEQKKASPAYFVNNGSNIPFLLMSAGIKDGKRQTLTKEMTEEFKAALINAGHPAERYHYENSRHFDLPLGYGKGKIDIQAKVERFLNDVKSTGTPGL